MKNLILKVVKEFHLLIMFSRHHRRVVLLSIQDEAWRFGRYSKNVLRRLNINPRRVTFSYRSSLAVIGWTGRRRPSWIRHMSRPQRRGPSYASARIPLYGGTHIILKKKKIKSVELAVVYTFRKEKEEECPISKLTNCKNKSYT